MSGPKRDDGALDGQVVGYRAWLVQRGYTPGTVRNMLKDLGRVGRWLSGQGLTAGDLNEQVVGAFVSDSEQSGAKRVLGPRAMVPLLEFLRHCGVTAVAVPVSSPLGALMDGYRTWMLRDRGLAPTTVLRYENAARRFLGEQCVGNGVFSPSSLTGADVNAFLLRECGRVSAGSAKGRVAELRAVLRFLYLQGIIEFQLGSAVPPVGGWRLAALPPAAVSAGDVQLLLGGIDRSTLVGARDFAIAMLVARLGLRSIEISRLELSDVDWRVGELAVRGKARRQDRMPLPAEVGEAMVEYLFAWKESDRRCSCFPDVPCASRADPC